MDKYNKSPLVSLGSSLIGIFLVIVIMFLIFAKEQAGLLIPIAWAITVLGFFLGYFQYKSLTDNKKRR